MGDNTAAALRHAVNLTLLDVKSGEHKSLGEDLRGKQGPLPTATIQQNISDFIVHLLKFLVKIS
jgi:hypothetical protein